jgi:periplasmic protein TonB
MYKRDLPDGKSHNPEPLHSSFDHCLVDGDSAVASRGSRRQAFGLSFAIEIALLPFVILSPLMTTGAQPHFIRSIYIPFPVVSPLRPKPDLKPAPPNHPTRYVFDGAPVPSGLNPPGPAPYIDAPGPQIEGPDLNPTGDSPGPAISFSQPKLVAPPVEDVRKSAQKLPLKLSEGVVGAQLISRIEPRYPPLALQTRTQGTVRLQAIISSDGRITSLVVLSGHPLLVQAALDAVRQWRYRPTMLDGEPVEVETTITVVFQLHS